MSFPSPPSDLERDGRGEWFVNKNLLFVSEI